MVWLGLTALIINVLITYTSGTNTTLNNTLTFDNQCNAKPLCKNLLEQFNLLTNELITTKKYFSEKSTNSLSVRGKETPLKTREQCKVSRDKMFDMRNEVNNALAKLTNKSSEEVTCEVDLVTDNSTSCAELMEFVRCGVDHLTQGILNTTSSENYKEYEKWKTAYDELFNEYEKTIDNVKQNLTQESKRQIDNLYQTVQTLKLQLIDIKEKFNKEKKRLIVSELDSEKIDTALQEFDKLIPDSTNVPEIVSKTYYNYTNKNNAMIIAKFISRLNNLTQKETGFRKLLEVLEAKRDTHSYSVVYIHYHVTAMLKYNLGSSTFQNLVSTKDKLQPYVDEVIDGWANEMRTNTPNNIAEASKIEDTFYLIIPFYAHQVVDKAYSNDKRNAVNITLCTRELEIEPQFTITLALFYLMEKHGHLDVSTEVIVVARRVKEMLDFLTKYYPMHEMIPEFEKVKMKMPKQIYDLYWQGQRCTIKNVQTSEYLYSPDKDFNFAKTRRYVFTWVPKNVMNEKFMWELKPSGNKEEFKIINYWCSEYMYSSVYHIVFTWIGGSDLSLSNWNLIPYKGNFFIFNNDVKRYLEPAGFGWDDIKAFPFNEDRRSVITPDNKFFVNLNVNLSSDFLNLYLWDISCLS